MNGNKAIDLHVHSNISDGTDSPEALVKKAINAGLSAFALTDHDTIDGISRALCEADRQKNSCAKIEVIPGVELSTHFDKTEIHIVGLFIDYENAALNSFLGRQVESRIARNKKVCELFQNIGINITYEDMENAFPNSVLTRAHFAARLVDMGICGDKNEAFDRFLSPSKPCYIKIEKVSPKTAIDIIHDAGGLAILAHPVLYHLGNVQMNRLLDYVCECGIDGIEAMYSTYRLGDELYVRRIAKERNLLISGGSDYHGNNKPHISLGTGMGHLFIPYEILEKLKNHLILPR